MLYAYTQDDQPQLPFDPILPKRHNTSLNDDSVPRFALS